MYESQPEMTQSHHCTSPLLSDVLNCLGLDTQDQDCKDKTYTKTEAVSTKTKTRLKTVKCCLKTY